MHHDIAAKSPGPRAARLVSLDAYRGAIMLLMASGGLGLARATRDLDPGSPWKWVGYQVEHAEWAGATLWDFIQPGFMFMVGVALPWSLASRTARGQRFGDQFVHALWRSLVLVLLAVFLTSAGSPQTNWVFTNVLAQIGLGYPFLFLLAFTRPRAQWLAAAGILVAYWLALAPIRSRRRTSTGRPSACPTTGRTWRASPPTGRRTPTSPPPSTAGS